MAKREPKLSSAYIASIGGSKPNPSNYRSISTSNFQGFVKIDNEPNFIDQPNSLNQSNGNGMQTSALEARIAKLEQELEKLKNPSQYDPVMVRAATQAILKESEEVPGDYDQVVNEAGSGSYQVAKDFDGFKEIEDNVIIGYYTKV